MTRPICRHCGREIATRPRGLGWRCYYTPGVKDLYPPTSKYARRGVGNLTGERPLPEPVPGILPGTGEKVALMGRRAAAGLPLFHPAEPRCEPCGEVTVLRGRSRFSRFQRMRMNPRADDNLEPLAGLPWE